MTQLPPTNPPDTQVPSLLQPAAHANQSLAQPDEGATRPVAPQTQAAPPSDQPPAQRPRHLLLKRLALALGSLAFTWTLLELTAWFLTPNPSPYWLRDGIYVNALPLVTGYSAFGIQPPLSVHRLPEDKRPGEIRILVFGESSVEGIPLDHFAAPPTLLHDELRKAFPDKDFTVINMGKTGSISANVFYYLLASRRFQPDVIIFYFGANDATNQGGESCWAWQHPATHGVWRFLVSNSPLLRSVRIYLPQLMWASTTSAPEIGCPTDTFPQWADLLVETAADIAPTVVVTTHVRTVLAAAECDGQRPLHETMADPEYKQLVRCRLDPTCDMASLFKERVATTNLASLIGAGRGRFAKWDAEMRSRSVGWQAAAAAHGATFVDFQQSMRDLAPNGLLGLPHDLFADEIHLTPRGYLFLARHWVEALRPGLSGQPSRHVDLPTPAEAAYYAQSARTSGYSMLLNYVRRGWLLSVLDGFEMIATYQVAGVRRPLAELVLGWARQQVGLPHNLPPDLAPLLAGFDPTTLDPQQIDDTWLWQRMNSQTETP